MGHPVHIIHTYNDDCLWYYLIFYLKLICLQEKEVKVAVSEGIVISVTRVQDIVCIDNEY